MTGIKTTPTYTGINPRRPGRIRHFFLCHFLVCFSRCLCLTVRLTDQLLEVLSLPLSLLLPRLDLLQLTQQKLLLFDLLRRPIIQPFQLFLPATLMVGVVCVSFLFAAQLADDGADFVIAVFEVLDRAFGVFFRVVAVGHYDEAEVEALSEVHQVVGFLFRPAVRTEMLLVFYV